MKSTSFHKKINNIKNTSKNGPITQLIPFIISKLKYVYAKNIPYQYQFLRGEKNVTKNFK